MKLHIGNLYWPKVTKIKNLKVSELVDEEKTDILIVGAGISGALSAYQLSKSGYKVTLIEKNTVGSGSTSANTGLIQYMSDKGVNSFIEQIGYEEATNFYNESVEAIETLIDINNEVDEIETETFETLDSLILATEKEKIEDLVKEVEVQKELGYEAEFFDENELNREDISAFGGLKATPDISLNPYGFVNRLIYTGINKHGLSLVEHTEFIDFSSMGDCLKANLLFNEKEVSLYCNKIIFATGYNPPLYLREKMDKIQINKTYVTVSKEEVDAKIKDYLVWEVKDPYTYYKKTFENKLMIGGLDVEDDKLTEEDYEKNKYKLIELVNNLLVDRVDITPEHSYAALFGVSKDDLPYMGVDPDNNNVFVICGVGGNGTVYSTIASKIVSKWIKGEDISKYNTFRIGR